MKGMKDFHVFKKDVYVANNIKDYYSETSPPVEVAMNKNISILEKSILEGY